MTGDLNSQYIPFYAHFYDAVREGGSLFYADDLGMGGGAFALFAYYFASPFAWLYLLIAPEFYGRLCCLVYALKVILAAAAFCFYLQRRRGGENALWLPLCWCYGLMGYSVAYAQNVLWLDAVILLPLVCAGLDRLLAGKGAVGFCLALAAAVFTNFYMGYMLCAFSVLYFVAGLAVQTPRPGAKAVVSIFGRFAAAGVTAAALAGAVLLPAVTEILRVKSTGFDLSGGGQFSPLELVQKPPQHLPQPMPALGAGKATAELCICPPQVTSRAGARERPACATRRWRRASLALCHPTIRPTASTSS